MEFLIKTESNLDWIGVLLNATFALLLIFLYEMKWRKEDINQNFINKFANLTNPVIAIYQNWTRDRELYAKLKEQYSEESEKDIAEKFKEKFTNYDLWMKLINELYREIAMILVSTPINKITDEENRKTYRVLKKMYDKIIKNHDLSVLEQERLISDNVKDLIEIINKQVVKNSKENI